MTKPAKPSTNGQNGRDTKGRFTKGNSGGPGNPHARQAAQLRATLLKAVTAKDLREVVEAMLRQAKQGNIAAAKLLLDRTLGPPVEIDLLARLEALEAQSDRRG